MYRTMYSTKIKLTCISKTRNMDLPCFAGQPQDLPKHYALFLSIYHLPTAKPRPSATARWQTTSSPWTSARTPGTPRTTPASPAIRPTRPTASSAPEATPCRRPSNDRQQPRPTRRTARQPTRARCRREYRRPRATWRSTSWPATSRNSSISRRRCRAWPRWCTFEVVSLIVDVDDDYGNYRLWRGFFFNSRGLTLCCWYVLSRAGVSFGWEIFRGKSKSELKGSECMTLVAEIHFRSVTTATIIWRLESYGSLTSRIVRLYLIVSCVQLYTSLNVSF